MHEQAQTVLPFLKKGVAQIALVVPNLEEACDNYWKHFGIGDWHFYTYGRPLVKKMSYYGKPADYKMRIALSWLGPTRIELIEMISGDTPFRDFVQEHGYGVQHFGFLVDNMQEALAEAEKAGIAMIYDGSGFGLDGDGHYAFLDTEKLLGVTIELIDRPKGRHEPEKIYHPTEASEQ